MSAPGKRLRSLGATLRTLRSAARLYRTNASLSTRLQPLRYLRRRLAGRFPVPTAVVALTYRCQARCPHCFAAVEGRRTGGEMTTEGFRRVLDQIRDLGALQVTLTGGEPLLREDLPDLVSHASRVGLLARLSTNGHLLTRDRVVELKRAGLTQCGVSIDDADPEVHDRLRGLRGSFARAVEALAHLREQGIDRKILVYASRDKITAGLERIVDLGRRLKVNTVHINIPFAVGRWEGSPGEVLSAEEMALLRPLLRDPLAATEFPTPETPCCAFAKTILGVTPAGEVLPCPAVPFPIGDLGREPLENIWLRHARALHGEWRGQCPLNSREGRSALIAHGRAMLDTRSADRAS